MSVRLSLKISVTIEPIVFYSGPVVILGYFLGGWETLKISVTIEPIGFYSSGNIPTGPVVILGYYNFLGGWDTLNPQKNNKIPINFFLMMQMIPNYLVLHHMYNIIF